MRSFLINEDNFLQNVMVWVNNPKHSADVPSNPIELDQVGCKYIPHVTGIMEGQELLIKNSDKTLHNIHSMSKVNSAFNFAMPNQTHLLRNSTIKKIHFISNVMSIHG